ncbi:hypothetical protein B0H67DRAFT_641872 [Lasiosphaeris hirsuta]|uniref:Uncharacterized protein n=1 Tax=Lasiosphaeris hirsuta TaxID=260670 RepID=A0AA40E562_9PEZI|nr:hypothetical protein B0H67DRAFT_641872 [Lasiosphaeris hirsuta]
MKWPSLEDVPINSFTEHPYLSHQHPPCTRRCLSEDVSLASLYSFTIDYELARIAAVQLLSSCLGNAAEPTIIPGQQPGAGYDGPLSTCSGDCGDESPREGGVDERVGETPVVDSGVGKRPVVAEVKNYAGRMFTGRWRRRKTVPTSPNRSSTDGRPTDEVSGLEGGKVLGGRTRLVAFEQTGEAPKESLDLVSCPEFGRESPASQRETSGHVRYGPIPARNGAHRYRMLGRKFKRSKSVSAVSISSERSSLSGRERRLINRDSYIYSERRVFFNKPSSEHRSSPNLIAIAGMMIAIGELDRLSFMADSAVLARASGQITAPSSIDNSPKATAPPNTPITQSGLSSVSPSGISTPAPHAPPNSPMLMEGSPATSLTGPWPPGKYGRVKQILKSRLSEVHSSMEIPEESPEWSNFESFPQFFHQEDMTPEADTGYNNTPMFSPSSNPPANRYFNIGGANNDSESGTKPNDHETLEYASILATDNSSPKSASDGPNADTIPRHRTLTIDALCLHQQEEITSWKDLWKKGQISVPTPEHGAYPGIGDYHAVPCRTDNWSPSQGEPGDSDPFCAGEPGEHGAPGKETVGELKGLDGTGQELSVVERDEIGSEVDEVMELVSLRRRVSGLKSKGKDTLPHTLELQRMGKVTSRR